VSGAWARDPAREALRARWVAAGLSGALGGLLGAVLLGVLRGAAGAWWASFLRAGGWLAIALAGAGLALHLEIARAGATRRVRPLLGAWAVLLVGLGLGVQAWRAVEPDRGVDRRPPPPSGRLATARAKAQAMRRWSYRSPATVAAIVPLARDPDPIVREQAVLALGVNLIVSDVERASPRWPSRYAGLPVRDSLRAALLTALYDSLEAVRAEAARALWKAPRTFGLHPEAAETLAAVLDRATRPRAVERLAWLALDAAAGAPHPRLKAAAARFAEVAPDSELARAARLAASANHPRR
jgi:hypothetical protein